MRLDLHVHLNCSIDTENLRKVLAHKNLDGIAITNFHDTSIASKVKSEIDDYIIIVGQEVVSLDGHILALGIEEKIPDYISVKSTVRLIHEQNGIAIAAHPYFFNRSISLWNKVKICGVDAIETYNSLCGSLLFPNFLANVVATKLKISKVAGTDAKKIDAIGTSYTEIDAADEYQALEAIKKGETIIHKQRSPLCFSSVFKRLNILNRRRCDLHCTLCGRRLAQLKTEQIVVCGYCGVKESTGVLCPEGHYVCDDCFSLDKSAVVLYKNRHFSCPICGEDLVWLRRQEPMVCNYCGIISTTSVLCRLGHYVCGKCFMRKNQGSAE